jgi:hypothetical protein
LSRSHLGHRAIGSMIGGIIILVIFLGALTAFVVIDQQYDSYQNTFYNMSQNSVDRNSENVTAVYPGVKQITAAPCSLCEYDLILSNDGGVGVQLVQIYINTTLSGSGACTISNGGPCVLKPSSTQASFTFDSNTAFLNAGELNHTVHFWLPFSLPNEGLQGPASPANTFWMATSRGRIFSFQWPFAMNPLSIPGFTPNLIRGFTKISWAGSKADPGVPQTSDDSGSVPPYSYCSGALKNRDMRIGPDGTTQLYFVNPWVDPSIIEYAAKPQNPLQTIYLYARMNNTSGGDLSLTAGTVILETSDSGANNKIYFIGGPYLGAYYPVTSKTLTKNAVIDPMNSSKPPEHNGTFIALFELTNYDQTLFSQIPPGGAIFLGTASMNNRIQGGGYTSMIAFLDGIYVRPCSGFNP